MIRLSTKSDGIHDGIGTRATAKFKSSKRGREGRWQNSDRAAATTNAPKVTFLKYIVNLEKLQK